ncbi:MAG: hypothetical protein AABZ06_15140, partial [Bdellovibrionota bacterium]
MERILTLVSSLIFIILFSVSFDANAGNVLKLKAGTFRAENFSESLISPKIMDIKTTRYFVVQFKEKVTEEKKAMLSRRGLEPKFYLPDDAIIVKGTQSDALLTDMLSGDVRAVVPYQPEWKI